MTGEPTTGKLTTHVLDTAFGCPASQLKIELWQINPPIAGTLTSTLIKTVITDADGRTPSPLLADSAFAVGTYELRFDVGAYFSAKISDLPDPPFLDIVPIRFSIADPSAHYHVPLLCSPWSYSTYRGS